ADDVGGRPDRIEDLQIRMHHRAQGGLGRRGRRRNRKAGRACGGKNGVSEHVHFLHLHCRVKAPEFLASDLDPFAIEVQGPISCSITSSPWPGKTDPPNDWARLTQYPPPAKPGEGPAIDGACGKITKPEPCQKSNSADCVSEREDCVARMR